MRITLIFSMLTFLGAQEKLIFDTSLLNDPEPKWPIILNSLWDDSLLLEDLSQSENTEIILEGFRVQVLATQSLQKADRLKGILSEKYGSEIYINFEAPNYKVRVGNFILKADAEKLRSILNVSGYPQAWIIRSRIDLQRIGGN
ncbi:MAG: SPOR domain-containing protein [Candidatus Neomarinimicrobiota bacterium]